MKDQVLDFLGNPPKSKPEQFNQALAHYRNSKNHNPSQVRFMNTLGFSEDRLASLLYDLKKLHNITDVQVANARSAKAAEVAKVEEDNTPVPLTKEEIAEIKAALLSLDPAELSEENQVAIAAELRTVFTADPLEDPGTPDGLITLMQARFTAELEVKDPKSPGIEFTHAFVDEALNLDPADLEVEGEVVPADSADKNAEDAEENVAEVIDAGYAQLAASAASADEFLSQLSAFDVEKEKYQALRSFAAVVSDTIGEEPAGYKSEDLKAFVLAAKKKYQAA